MDYSLVREQLAPYGYTVDDAGRIHKGAKALSVSITSKGKRLQARGPDGQLLWSGPDAGFFVEKFWYAKKSGELRGLSAGPNLSQRLVSYVTQYDERQSKGKYYNKYALGKYLEIAERLEPLADDPQKFAEALSKAFLPGFKPREVLLKAIAEGNTGPIKLYGRVKKREAHQEDSNA